MNQGKGTTTYVLSGWIGVLRLFRNISWSKIKPSRIDEYLNYPSVGFFRQKMKLRYASLA